MDLALNLADPRVHAEHDLTGRWRHLRETDPVHWHETPGEPGFWVITRYGDTLDVYRDDKTFSSEHGNVLDTLLSGRDSAAGRMLAVSDGERHASLRRVLSRAFTPQAMDLVIRSMRVGTRQLVDSVRTDGSCDFVRDVAAKIPLAAVCDLLRVPLSDRGYILGLTSSALASADHAPTEAGSWNSKAEILLYFADLLRRRREQLDDDIISIMIAGSNQNRPLTDEEIVVNCYGIVMAGDETTRLAMTGGLLAMIEHPEQWRKLKSGDVSVESAVEEILRWTTPTLHAGRTATRELKMHDTIIRPGDIVTAWNISANFDEEQFARPRDFDLSRNPNKHVTFAYGRHFCLGAHLARAELTELLLSLRSMIAGFELEGPPKRIFSNFLNGYSSLPLSVTAKAR
jgi:cytochrome P450